MKIIFSKRGKYITKLLQNLSLITYIPFSSCENNEQSNNQSSTQKNIPTNLNEERKTAWKLRLKDFQEFQNLEDKQQNQAIELFIKENVYIDLPNDRLKRKLKEFIDKFDKDEQDALVVNFTSGNAEINNENFDLNTFEGLKNFAEKVKGKKIKKIGNFSYDFVSDKKIKICEGNEIELSDFTEFLDILNSLVEVEGLNIKSILLEIETDGILLDNVKCSNNVYKGNNFWTFVKNHNALFGLSDKKLPIEKNENSDDATVKIKGKLVTNLKWNDVFDEDGRIIKEDWNKIFKLKEKVTVDFFGDGSYKIVDTDKTDTINNVTAIGLNDLQALEKLVQNLDCKDITVKNVDKFKIVFENNGKVKIGKKNTVPFSAVDKKNFETFLFHLDNLKKCINFDPQITLTVDSKVTLGGKKVDDNFAKSKDFWKSIKNHVGLFGSLGTDKLKITNDSQNVKIKNFETELSIETVCQDINNTSAVFNDGWDLIFTKN